MEKNQWQWAEIIRPSSSIFDFRLKEIWKYRDLWWMFVTRDFIASYKQTILGPLWFVLQPVLTSLMYSIVFGGIAGISTDGLPKPVFYLSGITLWNYFADCLNKNSSIFVSNARLFGKIYFPRLITPLSVITSGLIKLCIQLLLFFGYWLYFKTQGAPLYLQWQLAFLPVLVLLSAVLGLGFGLMVSALTTKYRDLAQLLGFGVQLAMYATPIIYPMNSVPSKFKFMVGLNPVTYIVENFRYSVTGVGYFSYYGLAYTAIFAFITFLLGLIIFKQIERNFMDTV